jgi:flagellin-specific chaperone FliS
MFIKELSLYVDHLRNEIQKASDGLIDRTAKNFQDFKNNLLSAIEYYQGLAEQFSMEQKEKFLSDLDALFEEIEKVLPKTENLVPIRVIS